MMNAKVLRPVLFLTLSLVFLEVGAQESPDISTRFFIAPKYGVGIPEGDLNKRFGTHFNFGGKLSIITPGRLYFGVNYSFIFGSHVKEDVLSNLRTIEGGIIGSDMRFASVFLRERGHHFYSEAGYFLSKNGKKAVSGFLFAAGLGYLLHKVRIVDEFDSVVQLRDDYIKGYDRLTGGLSISQSLSYLFFSHDSMINFYLSAHISEGFTKNLRGINYDNNLETAKRLDVMAGVEVGWIIHLFRRP